jgi:hypothetical protein
LEQEYLEHTTQEISELLKIKKFSQYAKDEGNDLVRKLSKERNMESWNEYSGDRHKYKKAHQ